MKTHLYTKGQFIDFCQEVFGEYQITNSGKNIQVVCPICSSFKGKHYDKKKLAIETTTHLVHCWICSYKSKNLLHLIRRYKSDFAEQYIEDFKNSILLDDKSLSLDDLPKTIALPDEYVLLAPHLNTNDAHINAAINYLKARGIHKEEDMWYWKFGITKASRAFVDRIIIPSFDNYGKLNYYTARTIKKDVKPKYLNPYTDRENIIFNELNLQWDKELTIVEGAFDLIKCNENATCILGSDLTANYELFQKIVLNKTPIVLGLDPDAQRKTIRIAERLYEFCVPVRIIEYNSMDDIGSKSKNQFNELLENAKMYDMEYMLRHKLSLL